MKFSGGIANASSTFSSTYGAEEAFKPEDIGVGNPWMPSRSEVLPQSVWYDFENRRFRPTKISFLSRQDYPTHLDLTPTSFQFVGTNDGTLTEP